MKKILIVIISAVLLINTGCSTKRNSAAYFYFDTVVNITADCDEDTLNGAFKICEYYENMLSRTKETSDIYLLNAGDKGAVNDEAVYLINEAGKYYGLSGGLFDITICSVSELYDFNDGKLPDEEDLKPAIEKVDYRKITIDGNFVSLNGTEIDLGGMAKGYVADKIAEYFRNKGVNNATVNLGGNLKVIGKKQVVGIKKPFSPDEISAKIEVKDTSVVTSGIYERCFYKDGKFYHHILLPETGKPVDTDLYSATVICEDSLKADALSTVCILLGREKAVSLINGLTDVEAIFIDSENNLIATDGLILYTDTYKLR